MNKPWNVITALEINNSRKTKDSILKHEAMDNNDEFFIGVRIALDPLVTLGVKKVPVHGGPDGPGLLFGKFLVLVEKLKNRELSGNAARDAIIDCLNDSTRVEFNNWYRRILIKDLKCGISQKTVNKIVKKSHPEYLIPVFSVQLAKDAIEHPNKVSGKKIIDNKIDGVRLITIVFPDSKVDQYSRNGKEIVNYQFIKDEFSAIAHTLSEPMVYDGEISSSSFQDLMTQLYRKDYSNDGNTILKLFDVIPLSEFNNGISTLTQLERSEYLSEWYSQHKFRHIELIKYQLIDLDTPSGYEEFVNLNNTAINMGLEGIMLKDPNALYELKRTTAWLKLKPFIELSMTVIGVVEGLDSISGMMGSLLCSCVKDGITIVTNVGGGFTDQQRAKIWANYTKKPVSWKKIDQNVISSYTEYPTDDIIGYIIEVRADAITKNIDGGYSLRFARFKGFRGTAPGEIL